MILLDVNILLYAHNELAPQQRAAAAWLDSILSGSETIGLPIQTVWAFLRLSTSQTIFQPPLTADQAFGIVTDWLRLPMVRLVAPGPEHFAILHRLMSEGNCSGRMVTDATLAALAVEFNATIASADRDFDRFSGIKWVRPI